VSTNDDQKRASDACYAYDRRDYLLPLPEHRALKLSITTRKYKRICRRPSPQHEQAVHGAMTKGAPSDRVGHFQDQIRSGPTGDADTRVVCQDAAQNAAVIGSQSGGMLSSETGVFFRDQGAVSSVTGVFRSTLSSAVMPSCRTSR
jgi:hypothetical protein